MSAIEQHVIAERTDGGSARDLVAAGVVLRGDQYQARAGWRRFGLRRMAERGKDSEDSDVRGQDAETDGS